MKTLLKFILMVLEVLLFFCGLMACQPQMPIPFPFLGIASMVLGSLVIMLAWKKLESE